MILAVAAHVEGKGPPPPELERVIEWETFGALPEAGGTRDQRAGELDRMVAAKNYRDVWEINLRRPEGWMRVMRRREAMAMVEYVKRMRA